jgi:hypothetical protein
MTMTESLKNLLEGAGSVMNVFPASDYLRYVPTETAEERMRGHWERTGEHLKKAMNRFADEQQEPD